MNDGTPNQREYPMAFELTHELFTKRFNPKKLISGETVTFEVAVQGEFFVRHPGALHKHASATYTQRIRVDAVGPEPAAGDPPRPGHTPLHGGWAVQTKDIPLTLRILRPDGREHTADHITLADLDELRDARGAPVGPWKYTLSGESPPVFVDQGSRVSAKGLVRGSVVETVPSSSAPPLVPKTRISTGTQTFAFDLYRVGTFSAQISRTGIRTPWRGTLRLLDPNGASVAQTNNSQLTVEVGLRMLDLSRDAAGGVRQWTLEVHSESVSPLGGHHVDATVIGRGRVTLPSLRSRIDRLLGPRGSFIEIYGENDGRDAVIRLEVTDIYAAETIDMHGLLDGVLRDVEQNPGTPTDFRANTKYTLFRMARDIDYGLNVEFDALSVDSIDVTLGPGVLLGPTIPAARLSLAVSGKIKVKAGAVTVATAKVNHGKLDVEIGLTLGADGVPLAVAKVSDDPIDLDAGAAASLITLGLADVAMEYVERQLNEMVEETVQSVSRDPTTVARILMMIFGAHLSYRPFRIEGNELVFDHIAPLEPDLRPDPHYRGAIGRTITQLVPGQLDFVPHTLGNTWQSDNLRKIDHIVVVMMENRSYDHVLGYRARPPIQDGADGLTDAMVSAIQSAPNGPYVVRPLREAGFPPNAAGKMTRLPKGVGHELDDVTEQLSVRATTPEGRTINSPKGFVDNFEPRLRTDPQGVVRDDVLGYYGADDLPFFAYLADNYAYCDLYYCSHPGPTLPNRMYSLTGDVQRDRYDFPILDNNDGDNFLLSRATTIYDVLARKGLGFRVYESQPSVTMLRMFARYATNDIDIVSLDRLADDVARGDLPAFTAIEPQMHAHPQDDDHPDADMHRGQQFIKRVYDALTSNPTLWAKTLLVITYDEHGGLYDHVVPPPADVFGVPSGPPLDPDAGGGSGSGRGGHRLPHLRPLPGLGLPTPGHAVPHAGLGAAAGVGPGADTLAPAASPTTHEARPPLTVPYGVRVPTFVVSPWTARGKGPSVVLDHCSILKTVLARFFGPDAPFLGDRVAASHSFDAFLTEASPRTDVPPFTGTLDELPADARRTTSPTSAIETESLWRSEMRDGPIDYHLLTGRWARQLGR